MSGPFYRIVAQFDSSDHGFDFVISITEGDMEVAKKKASQLLFERMVHDLGADTDEANHYIDRIMAGLKQGVRKGWMVDGADIPEHVADDANSVGFECLNIEPYTPGQFFIASKCDDLS